MPSAGDDLIHLLITCWLPTDIQTEKTVLLVSADYHKNLQEVKYG